MKPRAILLPLLMLLPLLAGCEVTLLNGRDPAQMTQTPVIGTPRARFAPEVYYPEAYYPYAPSYSPYYPMGLVRPHYPYRPPYPVSGAPNGAPPYAPPHPDPHGAYYPVHADDYGYYPYYPYYPTYGGDSSYYPYYPGAAFGRPVSGQPPACLPGYQAIPQGFEADGRPQSYLCKQITYGYGYYPG